MHGQQNVKNKFKGLFDDSVMLSCTYTVTTIWRPLVSVFGEEVPP